MMKLRLQLALTFAFILLVTCDQNFEEVTLPLDIPGPGLTLTPFADPPAVATVRNDSLDKKEGEFSTRIMLQVPVSGSGGWSSIWGEGSQEKDPDWTLDLSAYEQGSMSFYIKSPVDLMVKIRSGKGRIPPGDQDSKFRLSDIGFRLTDSDWQHVCVSLSAFKDKEPRLNFSEMKELFSIVAEEETRGTEGNEVTILIDDLKWVDASCE